METSQRPGIWKYNGVKVVIIQGGMTPLLQPADVCWNFLVKNKIKEFWRQWFESQLNESEGQPIKRASYRQICEWCIIAWDTLKPETIRESFKYVNAGKEYNMVDLHSRLKCIIEDREVEEECEHSGLTDEEAEVEETLDIEENSDNE